MMLTREDLKGLAAVTGPCLSIFLPVRDEKSLFASPYIRVHSALQQAEAVLAEKGFNSSESEELLRPLRKFAINTPWVGHESGVVLFRAPGFTVASLWPDLLRPRVRFGDEFLVLPLLPALLRQSDYWLLGLSIKSVRLFRGSFHKLTEVRLPAGVPASLREAGAFDQPDHTLRDRSSAGRSVGASKGVQFSTAPELETAYIHDFFKGVDRGIRPRLAADPQPLVLAGVSRELAIYRSANTYEPLIEGAVYGSPDATGVEALGTRAAELMAAHSAREEDSRAAEIEDAASRGLLITEPAAVIDAARDGRVAKLFVVPDTSAHEEALNWSALATIRNSGEVGILNASRLPGGVAAILRYRAEAL